MPRLSVIVPMFNVERYVGRCLDSLEAQAYSDIEIVCVNDGTPDASRDIAAEYARRDGRVRIIDKENGGLASARNAGIRAATGDYVCFLDADDTFTPDACATIMRAFDQHGCDVVVFGGTCKPEDRADPWIVEHLSPRERHYPVFEPSLLFEEMSHPYIRVAVRRNLLLACDLLFDETLRFGEDETFLFALYPQADGVALIPDKLYNYYQFHEESLMGAVANDDARKCDLDLIIAEHVFASWNARGYLRRYARELVEWSIRHVVYSILRQPAATRVPLTSRVATMWVSNCTDSEIEHACATPRTRRIVEIVLDCAFGQDPPTEREIQAACIKWRLAEYGLADAAHGIAKRFTR